MVRTVGCDVSFFRYFQRTVPDLAADRAVLTAWLSDAATQTPPNSALTVFLLHRIGDWPSDLPPAVAAAVAAELFFSPQKLVPHARIAALAQSLISAAPAVAQTCAKPPHSLLLDLAGGANPAHAAALFGNVLLLNALAAAGPSVVDLGRPDMVGKTPLHVAVAQKQPAAVEALIAAGVPLNAGDLVGLTPLAMAQDDKTSVGEAMAVALRKAGAGTAAEGPSVMSAAVAAITGTGPIARADAPLVQDFATAAFENARQQLLDAGHDMEMVAAMLNQHFGGAGAGASAVPAAQPPPTVTGAAPAAKNSRTAKGSGSNVLEVLQISADTIHVGYRLAQGAAAWAFLAVCEVGDPGWLTYDYMEEGAKSGSVELCLDGEAGHRYELRHYTGDADDAGDYVFDATTAFTWVESSRA